MTSNNKFNLIDESFNGYEILDLLLNKIEKEYSKKTTLSKIEFENCKNTPFKQVCSDMKEVYEG